MERALVDTLLDSLDLHPRERTSTRRCLAALMSALGRMRPPVSPDLVDHVLLDEMIADCDRRLGAQVDAILHSPVVQRLETAWRALRFVVERVRYEENICVEIVSCAKEDLANDFADASEIPRSGLYRLVYTNGLATFGGKPYGLVCANYDFGPGAADVSLLRYCAAVSAMAHAPFVANASANMFGLVDFSELPRVSSLSDMFEGPRYRFWKSLRDAEDARYVGLCLPRFLLRAPYSVASGDSGNMRFVEVTEDRHEDHLWGPASFAFAVRAAESFARFRWCVFMIGSRAGGMIDGLTHHDYPAMPGQQPRCPVECLITSRLDHAIAEQGFIGLVYDRASGQAMLHSAASVQMPIHLAETADGDAAAVGHRIGSQLPYVFLVSRLAHYLKRVQRERIGQWDSHVALQRELEQWLKRYVSDINEPHWETRARRPLRRAAIQVEVVEGQAGWYRCHLQVQPHLTHNSAVFTLSLVGRLDRPDRR